jgi:hypothetical protein
VAARKKISTIHWDSIVRGIKEGKCVPFLGAGANAGSDLPVGSEVARQLLEKLLERKVGAIDELIEIKPKAALKKYPDLGRARVEDLARVALHVEFEGGNPSVVAYMKEIIAEEERQPAEILRVLARLPFKLIVTTNYDCMLEQAFELEQKPRPGVLSQQILGRNPTKLAEWQARLVSDERIVYKLHGSFDDDEVNLVVSEDDYIQFLGIAADETRGIPNQIQQRIKTGVVLFLGYGLEDWDVRTMHTLLIGSQEPREVNRSFAIQWNPAPFWVKFWEKKHLTIYNMDLTEFAGQLEDEYAKRRNRDP